MNNIENAQIKSTMRGMAEREKVIQGLEAHANPKTCETCAGEYCPYYNRGGSYPKVTCSSFLAADALALLREQEPRVLTLEEIRSGTVEVVWLEDADKPNVIPGIWFRLSNEGGDEAVDIHVMDGFVGARLEVYGKMWRAWTSRPTEEQRKAVPWDAEP